MDAMDEGEEKRESSSDGWGEEVTPSQSTHPRPGDIIRGSGPRAMAEPLVGKDESTPLDEDEPEGIIPPNPLWAMKIRRHTQWHLLPSHERQERVRDSLGSGDETIYVMDDGNHHVMLGRRVGECVWGCEYSLVGRVSRERYAQLKNHTVSPVDAFEGASGIALCGVAKEEGTLSSNVFDVARYETAGDVPPEYRPGSPFLEFSKDLEITTP